MRLHAHFQSLIFAAYILAACGPISCVQVQPEPQHPWSTGVLTKNPVQPIIKPAIDMPTATEHVILKSPSPQINDQFGASIALTLNTLVVGAPNTTGGGAAWIFDLENSNAPPIQLVPQHLESTDAFGTSVAISDSGRFIAVGSPKAQVGQKKNVGMIHVWEKKVNQWSFVGTFTNPDLAANAKLGSTVAIGDDTLLAGAPFEPLFIESIVKSVTQPVVERIETKTVHAHGVVLTWMRDSDGKWNENITLQPDPGIHDAQFGGALSLKGTQLIVGAPTARASEQSEAGKCYIFLRRAKGWPYEPLVSISQVGNNAFKGEENNISGNGPHHHFGWAVTILGTVALSGTPEDSDGNFIKSGSVNIFQRANTTWIQTQYISAPDKRSDDAFGSSVGIAGTHFVIGAPLKSFNNMSRVGAVYVYQFSQTKPDEEEFLIKLLPSIPHKNSSFGAALSCTPDIIAISAPSATDPSQPGLIYIFKRTEMSWGVPGSTMSSDAPLETSASISPNPVAAAKTSEIPPQ